MHKDILYSSNSTNSTIYEKKKTWQRMIYNIYERREERKEGSKRKRKGRGEGGMTESFELE